jgi:hypothetical protein
VVFFDQKHIKASIQTALAKGGVKLQRMKKPYAGKDLRLQTIFLENQPASWSNCTRFTRTINNRNNITPVLICQLLPNYKITCLGE